MNPSPRFAREDLEVAEALLSFRNLRLLLRSVPDTENAHWASGWVVDHEVGVDWPNTELAGNPQITSPVPGHWVASDKVEGFVKSCVDRERVINAAARDATEAE